MCFALYDYIFMSALQILEASHLIQNIFFLNFKQCFVIGNNFQIPSLLIVFTDVLWLAVPLASSSNCFKSWGSSLISSKNNGTSFPLVLDSMLS